MPHILQDFDQSNNFMGILGISLDLFYNYQMQHIYLSLYLLDIHLGNIRIVLRSNWKENHLGRVGMLLVGHWKMGDLMGMIQSN